MKLDPQDPFLNLDAQTSPDPATPTIHLSKPTSIKQNTGLKWTLCMSVQKKKKSRKQHVAADIPTEEPTAPLPPTAMDIVPLLLLHNSLSLHRNLLLSQKLTDTPSY